MDKHAFALILSVGRPILKQTDGAWPCAKQNDAMHTTIVGAVGASLSGLVCVVLCCKRLQIQMTL